jgi:isoquinoline 1-oxidoreductase beta subunit
MDAGRDALVALVARCPVFGGTVRRFDAAAAGQYGVRHVVPSPRASPWSPRLLGRASWAEASNRWTRSTAALDDARSAPIARAGRCAGLRRPKGGDGIAAFRPRASSAGIITSYLAHATMEPMVRRPGPEGADLEPLGSARGRLVGGGARCRSQGAQARAGRVRLRYWRLADAVRCRAQASIARRRRRRSPIWSREDDLRHDHYRPVGLRRMRAGLRRQYAGRVEPSRGLPVDRREFFFGWLPDSLPG